MFKKAGGNWKMRVEHMLQAIEEIRSHTQGYDFQRFTEDTKCVRAVERNFEIIAEASKYIPSHIKDEFAYPWQDVIGMRNIISHEYQQINYKVLWDAIKIDVPALESLVLQIKEKYGEDR